MNSRTVSNSDVRIPKLLEQVRRMAYSIARSLPPSVQVDDLVAAGNLGVAAALARFAGDPATFDAFALVHARGAILDELRRVDTMSRLARRQSRRASLIANRLANRLGRAATDTEVAAEAGLDLDVYRDLVAQRSITMVDTSDHDRSDDHSVPADEQLDSLRTQRRLSAEIASLPSRHATVISLSFEHDQTLQSIATTLGVSVARAHQIRVAALDKLRRSFATSDVRSSGIAA